MNKKLYYTLNFTWGLPLTLIGLIVGLALKTIGYEHKKWMYGYYFEIGKGWGGLNLGVVFLCSKNSSQSLKNHEFGHSLQNCLFGVFTMFLIHIPSFVRYWYREIRTMRGLENKASYDDIWFEGQATKWGSKFYEQYKATNGMECI